MLTPALLLALLTSDAGTRADRAALYDYLVAKTMGREAFSPIKNERLGLDVREEMARFREELLDADTDEKLFHALVKISNARKDRHLSVDVIPDGLDLDTRVTHAAIRFLPDYADPGDRFLFVSDSEDGAAGLGDRLVAVNGRESFVEYLEPYVRYSTIAKLWWELAKIVPKKSHLLPREFYRDTLQLTLERESGERYDVSLPYRQPETIHWRGHDQPRYPGFDLAYSTRIYDLYRNFEDKKALLIAWRGFRESLVPDVDRLVDYAVENDLLDHAIIFDATRSRGGSKGVYLVQRLTGKPFKTTFGNLRLSDITPEFIQQMRERNDEASTEGVGPRKWLIDWLEDDVTQGLDARQAYSNNVPFKLAHLPEYSDGIVQPAETHFRGPLVVLLGPHGGSHLDQFASIVADNDLGYIIGMPAGGYSNTWEWEETLRFPTSGRPLVRYMWSIGHTIRPNGEILEGNPADVDELVPLTRDNFRHYYEELLERAYRHLGLD